MVVPLVLIATGHEGEGHEHHRLVTRVKATHPLTGRFSIRVKAKGNIWGDIGSIIEMIK